MPKNKGKGRKKRELVFKEDGQDYAQVARVLGNGRCETVCVDGGRCVCHIRGSLVRIEAWDVVLLSLRDYQDDNADVILKYMNDEARLLKAYGEIPDAVRLNDDGADDVAAAQDDYVQFEDEDIDKI